MRLGATITSERGKAVIKTGNEFIEIELLGEERQFLSRLNIHMFYDSYEIEMTDSKGETTLLESVKKKTNGNLNHGKLCNCELSEYAHAYDKSHHKKA